MASKTITAFERVVLLFDKTFVCTNRSARRLCASQCFYIQHAECAVDIILSFGRIRTTPVRGYWTVGFGMGIYSRQKIRDFSAPKPASCTEKSRSVFFFIQLLLLRAPVVFLSQTPESPFPAHLALRLAGGYIRKQVSVPLPEMCTSLWNIRNPVPRDPHH